MTAIRGWKVTLIRQAWPGSSSPVVGSIWNGLGDSQVKKVDRSLGVGRGGGDVDQSHFAPSDHCSCFRKVEMPPLLPHAGLSCSQNPPPSCHTSHLQASASALTLHFPGRTRPRPCPPWHTWATAGTVGRSDCGRAGWLSSPHRTSPLLSQATAGPRTPSAVCGGSGGERQRQ